MREISASNHSGKITAGFSKRAVWFCFDIQYTAMIEAER